MVAEPARSIILPGSFYARAALDVAHDLLGKFLALGDVTLRITEVEAYRWPDDTASHARAGKTSRNAAMWGPAGQAYIYLCYGMHNLLNIVTDREHQAAAVLIRACEPVRGLKTIQARRNGISGPALLTGPGKVAAALGLDRSWTGHALYRRGGLRILDAAPPTTVISGPRVGINYASPAHRDAPWRLACGDTEWVSRPKTLG